MSISSPAIAEWADGQSVRRRVSPRLPSGQQLNCPAILSLSRAIGETNESPQALCTQSPPPG